MSSARNYGKSTIFRILLLNIISRRSVQFFVLISITAIGIFATLNYQNFLNLQAQNISQLSVYNQIFKPLSGLTLLTQILLGSMVASQIVPSLFERGQQGIVIHTSQQPSSFVLICMQLVLVISFIPLAYFALIAAVFMLASPLDIALLASDFIGLFIGGFLFGTIAVAVSLLLRRTLISLVVCVLAVIVVLILDEMARNSLRLQSYTIYLDLFIHMREGLVFPFEIVRLFLWLILFYSLSVLAMCKLCKNTADKNVFVKKLVWVIIASLSIGVFGWFYAVSDHQKGTTTGKIVQWDVSHDKKNSLDKKIIEKLASIKDSIRVIAVIEHELSHDEIKKGFEILKQYHPNSTLEFTNSQADGANNKLAEQYVAIEIAGNRQSIRYPFSVSAKDSLLQLVLQLTTRTDQWITFIEGHGEASPFTKNNRDISQFYQSIKNLGWPVAVQNLIKRPRIASNTKILVVAASRKQWMPSEIDSIMRYLHEGGNLLLLREQKDQLPNELLSYLGISTELGVLIDWQGYQSGTPHPAILIVNQFTDHPVNTGIDSLLAFPWSYALVLDEKAKQAHRDYQTILATHTGVWTEFNSGEAELAFDEQDGELQQSFSIGYSLEDKQLKQRVIVMGDSSFLSDSAINNYANRQFSLNLISWLASESNVIISQPYRDSYIKATPLLHFILTWLFSLIFPLLFIGFLLAKRVNFGKRR